LVRQQDGSYLATDTRLVNYKVSCYFQVQLSPANFKIKAAISFKLGALLLLKKLSNDNTIYK
jgi:hypothetical protein